MEIQCAICWGEQSPDKPIIKLNCKPECTNPYYHSECIGRWLRQNPNKLNCIYCFTPINQTIQTQIITEQDQLEQDQVEQDQVEQDQVEQDEQDDQIQTLGNIIYRLRNNPTIITSIRFGNVELGVNYAVILILYILMVNIRSIAQQIDSKYKFNFVIGLNCISIFFIMMFVLIAFNVLTIRFEGYKPLFYQFEQTDRFDIKKTYKTYVQISIAYTLGAWLIDLFFY